mmetsp:Transcript_18076/g.49134  ORF Transcript_18076/g.49134 Transcript_18076/m.49134 type:complete len:226 (+) Transcript_18076:176-853(+)
MSCISLVRRTSAITESSSISRSIALMRQSSQASWPTMGSLTISSRSVKTSMWSTSYWISLGWPPTSSEPPKASHPCPVPTAPSMPCWRLPSDHREKSNASRRLFVFMRRLAIFAAPEDLRPLWPSSSEPESFAPSSSGSSRPCSPPLPPLPPSPSSSPSSFSPLAASRAMEAMAPSERQKFLQVGLTTTSASVSSLLRLKMEKTFLKLLSPCLRDCSMNSKCTAP